MITMNAGKDRQASSGSWIANLVAVWNRDQIEVALGKVRDLKGEFGLTEPL